MSMNLNKNVIIKSNVSKTEHSYLKLENKKVVTKPKKTIVSKKKNFTNKKRFTLNRKPFTTKDTIEFSELVNARCAIIGLISGKGFEYITNQNIQSQSVDYFPYILISALLVSASTLVVGKPDTYTKLLPFAVESELTIGRLSMLLYAFYFYTGV